MKTNELGLLEYEMGERFSWLDYQVKCVIDREDICGCDGCFFNSSAFKFPKSECRRLACCSSERKDTTSCHFVRVRVKGGAK